MFGVVARSSLQCQSDCHGIDRSFLGCLNGCYVIMWLLGCFVWLVGCCQAALGDCYVYGDSGHQVKY